MTLTTQGWFGSGKAKSNAVKPSDQSDSTVNGIGPDGANQAPSPSPSGPQGNGSPVTIQPAPSDYGRGAAADESSREQSASNPWHK